MKFKSSVLDRVIGAMQKVSHTSGERENLFAFVQSCYCGRVRNYDLDAAMQTLTRLSEEEQHALIAWVVATDIPAR